MSVSKIETFQKLRDWLQVGKSALRLKYIPSDRLTCVIEALDRYHVAIKSGVARRTHTSESILLVALRDYCPEFKRYGGKHDNEGVMLTWPYTSTWYAIACFMRVPIRVVQLLTSNGKGRDLHEIDLQYEPYNNHVLYGITRPDPVDSSLHSHQVRALRNHVRRIRDLGYYKFQVWHYDKYWECSNELRRSDLAAQMHASANNYTYKESSKPAERYNHSRPTSNQVASNFTGRAPSYEPDTSHDRIFDLATYQMLASSLDDTSTTSYTPSSSSSSYRSSSSDSDDSCTRSRSSSYSSYSSSSSCSDSSSSSSDYSSSSDSSSSSSDY